ncbi:MAG TPA: TrkA C-terminal domain-containing protein [Candidatus Sulfotelmatobacter sp.]|nr:TrkA C-terminal domain-containing protein [Candidatus Sulfotelmatobacter sp.]
MHAATFFLQETLARPAAPQPEETSPPLAGLLKEAEVKQVAVGAGSPAQGKRIGELALRTRTGASIVAIERDGQCLVNPGPEEEVLEGDLVMLLGKAAQLETAIRVLEGGSELVKSEIRNPK